MTTLLEASKQALDALENLWLLGDHAGTIAAPSILALRIAISEAKKEEPAYQMQMADGSWIDQEHHSYQYNLYNGHKVRIVYLAAGAQPAPKQEPVAWRYRVNNTHTLYSECPVPDDAYDAGTLTPLYAAPTQAQPVKPLTDDDIHERYKSVRTNDTRYIDIYRDAEAAHNIKEQP